MTVEQLMVVPVIAILILRICYLLEQTSEFLGQPSGPEHQIAKLLSSWAGNRSLAIYAIIMTVMVVWMGLTALVLLIMVLRSC